MRLRHLLLAFWAGAAVTLGADAARNQFGHSRPEFESSQFPALKNRIEEAAGFAVPLEVYWDSLAVPGESRLYAEAWPQIYFEPLIAGLKTVCRDDAGKDAVKSQVKKIVIQNVKGCVYGDCWATFEDGVLTLDHDSVSNINDNADRERGLVTVLESRL